ncbi:formyltransferase family protein [Accumulibacter sp.]|uniref:formyltransferase family protein n=1 Tax=Accumulibacter sp. TaxID=2053492 RepID=UPI0035B262A7
MTLAGCFVGGTAFAVRCAERWLERGHVIAAVLPRGPALRELALAHGIPVLGTTEGLREAITSLGGFDVLFSIINDLVLDASVLALARRVAINYHNAPLPRYAGVFASSWALINGEHEHGVCWHVMTVRVDAGNILASTRFRIERDDTAASLNTRCQAIASTLFDKVVDAVESSSTIGEPQCLSERIYYPLHRKPPGGGVIRWNLSAEEIDRQVRALSRGSIVNSFERPKIAWRDRFIVPGSLQAIEGRGRAAPGEVVKVEPDGLVVATSTENVLVRLLELDDGTPVSPGAVVAGIGEHLPIVSAEQAGRLERALSLAAADENFCSECWRDAVATDLRQPVKSGASERRPVDATAAARITKQELSPAWSMDLLASLDVMLARLQPRTGHEAGSVLISTPAMRMRAEGLEAFLDTALPLTVSLPWREGDPQRLSELARRLARIDRSGSCGRDLPLRYKVAGTPRSAMPVVFIGEPANTRVCETL